MPVGKWKTDALDNQTSDIGSGIDQQEGMLAPKVNNSSRSTMAELAKQFEDNNGIASTSVVASSITTYSVTLESSVQSFSELRGFVFIPDTTNEGASLINVTGNGETALGAKNITDSSGVNIRTNDLKVGVPVKLTYNGTVFVAMGIDRNGVSVENILDNPLGYIGIIDQISQGTSAVPLDGFPVDRWVSYISSGGTATISADGTFSFDRPLSQFVEEFSDLAGRDVMICAEYVDVDVTIKTGQDTSVNLPAGVEIAIPSTWQTGGTDPDLFSIQAASGATDRYSIKGLSLKATDVATSFSVPKYGNELAKCKRYCQNFAGGVNLCPSAGYNTNVSFGTLLFTPSMESEPTHTVSSAGALELQGNNTSFTGAIQTSSSDVSSSIRIDTSSITQGFSYNIIVGGGEWIRFRTGR